MTRPVWSNDEPTDLPPNTDKNPSGKQSYQGLSRLGCCAVRAGQQAPRFRLPDQHGGVVVLSALLAKGAVVLRFCHHDGTSSRFHELDALAAVHLDIEQRGATLAAITAQPLFPHPADIDHTAYAFPLLTDKESMVARSYGLTYRLPPIERSPGATANRSRSLQRRGRNGCTPATYVVDQQCVVALAFVDPAGRSRMEPDQIVMALECLNKRNGLKSGIPDGANRGGIP